jgi:hypothetical protein
MCCGSVTASPSTTVGRHDDSQLLLHLCPHAGACRLSAWPAAWRPDFLHELGVDGRGAGERVRIPDGRLVLHQSET